MLLLLYMQLKQGGNLTDCCMNDMNIGQEKGGIFTVNKLRMYFIHN